MNATHLTDQLDAAAQEARSIVRHAASVDGKSPEWVQAPGWLSSHIAGIQLAVLTGRGRHCRHLTASPSVVWSAVWRPGEVWCVRCALDAYAQIRGTAEDNVCDACRCYAKPIFSCVTACGPLMVASGLCGRCREDVQFAQPSGVPAPRLSDRGVRR